MVQAKVQSRSTCYTVQTIKSKKEYARNHGGNDMNVEYGHEMLATFEIFFGDICQQDRVCYLPWK